MSSSTLRAQRSTQAEPVKSQPGLTDRPAESLGPAWLNRLCSILFPPAVFIALVFFARENPIILAGVTMASLYGVYVALVSRNRLANEVDGDKYRAKAYKTAWKSSRDHIDHDLEEGIEEPAPPLVNQAHELAVAEIEPLLVRANLRASDDKHLLPPVSGSRVPGPARRKPSGSGPTPTPARMRSAA